jgi:hypothetical protein
MTEPTTGCVICAAKSTQDRNASIPEQIVDARGMAVDNDWTIAGEFSDENFSACSAYSGNRGPGLESAKTCAIQAAKDTGQIAMLIAQAHDRFARGAGDAPGAPRSLGEIWHELRRLNVWLRTVEDDDELRDEESVAAAIGRRAHIDSKRKSRAVSKGLRRRAADRGKLSGGPRPYGYRWEGPTGEKILVIVPAEAAVVTASYVATIAGVSQRALARSLNADRIPTVNGKAWLQATLGRLLANPIYRGQIRHAGQVYDGAHEAIITADLWDQQPRSARTPPAARVAAGRRARTCSPAVCSAAPAVRPCFPAPTRADPATRSICAPVDSLTSSVRSGPGRPRADRRRNARRASPALPGPRRDLRASSGTPGCRQHHRRRGDGPGRERGPTSRRPHRPCATKASRTASSKPTATPVRWPSWRPSARRLSQLWPKRVTASKRSRQPHPLPMPRERSCGDWPTSEQRLSTGSTGHPPEQLADAGPRAVRQDPAPARRPRPAHRRR